ncbi:MAG: hypothetical protein GF311_27165 [Candidatus Lokiarchaeota archaeon]|nr:hypothetical protein [Candidatus Lokiarchaeota archaeon]
MLKRTEKLIRGYLDEIKEELPEWLKDDKKELRATLDELEDHLRNKAMDISEGSQLTEEAVKSAIKSMGKPNKIAREYKKRGTPYIYITKELWPTYKRVVLIVFTILACISVFTMILNLLLGNFADALNFGGYMLGFFASLTIITVIFVFLSMEGYLPEDFISKSERERKEKELQKARDMGMPISPKTGKPLKRFVNPTEKYIGGAIGIIIAIILIGQPVPGFFSLMDQEFRLYMLLIGILLLFDSFTTFIRGFLGNNHISTHQAIHVFTIVLKVLAIPIFILMSLKPEIFPVLYWEGTTFINVGVPSEYYLSISIIMNVVAAIMGASIISNIYQMVKLEKYKR